VIGQKPCKTFRDYNWTPVNAPVKGVLMEIKKDPMFRKPNPILGKPLPQNEHKYCAYHKSNSHSTDTCVSLRKLIEQFIAKGKLTYFLQGQNGRSNVPQAQHQNKEERDQDDPPKYRSDYHQKRMKVYHQEDDRYEHDKD
jgi:hypothetical protein